MHPHHDLLHWTEIAGQVAELDADYRIARLECSGHGHLVAELRARLTAEVPEVAELGARTGYRRGLLDREPAGKILNGIRDRLAGAELGRIDAWHSAEWGWLGTGIANCRTAEPVRIADVADRLGQQHLDVAPITAGGEYVGAGVDVRRPAARLDDEQELPDAVVEHLTPELVDVGRRRRRGLTREFAAERTAVL